MKIRVVLLLGYLTHLRINGVRVKDSLELFTKRNKIMNMKYDGLWRANNMAFINPKTIDVKNRVSWTTNDIAESRRRETTDAWQDGQVVNKRNITPRNDRRPTSYQQIDHLKDTLAKRTQDSRQRKRYIKKADRGRLFRDRLVRNDKQWLDKLIILNRHKTDRRANRHGRTRQTILPQAGTRPDWIRIKDPRSRWSWDPMVSRKFHRIIPVKRRYFIRRPVDLLKRRYAIRDPRLKLLPLPHIHEPIPNREVMVVDDRPNPLPMSPNTIDISDDPEETLKYLTTNSLEMYDSEFVPERLAEGVNYHLTEPPKGNGSNFHWSYKGTTGPNFWGSHYRTCSGTRQSPVDIRDQNIIFQELPPFRFSGFDGRLCSFVLRNNGHTASISVSGNMTVEGGGLDGKYKTAELHFHWGSSNKFGSEHSINGRKYPLEMHIVNYATKYGSLPNAMRFRDGLAVLGTFFDVARENLNFRPFENGLRKAKYVGNFTSLTAVNLLGLLPTDTSRYYRYYGSLTTPPCHQSVMWTLFEDINYISVQQIQLLRQLYEPSEYEGRDRHVTLSNAKTEGMKSALRAELRLVDNYRPIQPDFDRVINSNIIRYADPQYIKQSQRVAPQRPASYEILTHSLSKVNIEDLFNKTLHRWLQNRGINVAQLTDVLSKQNSQPQPGSAGGGGNGGHQQKNTTLAQNHGQPLLTTIGNSKSFFDARQGQKEGPTSQRPLKHNSGSVHQRITGTPHQTIPGTPRQSSSGAPRQHSSGTSRQPISGTTRLPSSGTRSYHHGHGRDRPNITGIHRNRHSGSSHRQHGHGSPRRPVSTSRRPTSQPSWKKQLPTLSHQFGSKNIQALSGRSPQDQVTKLEPNASRNQQGVASQTRSPPNTRASMTIKPTTSPRVKLTRSHNVGDNSHPTSRKPITFPNTLDVQAVQTYRMGPNGEQIEEIQLEVDPTTGISREDLQHLLNNPSIIQQILRIVNLNGANKNNKIHEIMVPLPFLPGEDEQRVQNSPVPLVSRIRRTSQRFIRINRYRTGNLRRIYRYSH